MVDGSVMRMQAPAGAGELLVSPGLEVCPGVCFALAACEGVIQLSDTVPEW